MITELKEKDVSARISGRALPKKVSAEGVVATAVAKDGTITTAISDGKKWVKGSLKRKFDKETQELTEVSGTAIVLAAPVYDPRIAEGERPVLGGKEINWDRWGDGDSHYRHSPAPSDVPAKKK